MNIYIVVVYGDVEMHVLSVWQSLTNAQCERDRLNTKGDSCYAWILTMPIRDHAFGGYL